MPFISCSVIKSGTTSHATLAKAKEVHRARVWENSIILCNLGFWGEKAPFGLNHLKLSEVKSYFIYITFGVFFFGGGGGAVLAKLQKQVLFKR